MAKNKIKRTEVLNRGNSGIHPTIPKTKGLSFSFKYCQISHSKFDCSEKSASYWMALLERLKDLAGWTAKDFVSKPNKTLRNHPVVWEDTSENSFGLPNEEQLVDTPFEFSLTANEHGRVFGFLIEEVFYIVWFDPDHLLYPRK